MWRDFEPSVQYVWAIYQRKCLAKRGIGMYVHAWLVEQHIYTFSLFDTNIAICSFLKSLLSSAMKMSDVYNVTEIKIYWPNSHMAVYKYMLWKMLL